MDKRSYISLAALAGLTMGAFFGVRKNKQPNKESNSIVDNTTSEDAYSSSWSPAEKQTERYKRLLEKWGTKEGLIHVNEGSSAKKKKKERSRKLKAIAKKGQALTAAYKQHTKNKSKKKPISITQVTVTNHSDKEQEVSLWGAHSETEGIENLVETTEYAMATGVHPQSVIYNPANKMFYVVNQLSDSVSVFNETAALVQTILLNTTNFIGAVSPVDLAVNANYTSDDFGYVYVVGSVSDKVYVIDLTFAVVTTYNTQRRPLAIKFNAIDSSLVIANATSNSITQINLGTGIPSSTFYFESPQAVAVHPITNNLYVFNAASKTIDVLDSDYQFLKRGIEVATTKGKFAYHPKLNQVFFSVKDSDTVIFLDKNSHDIAHSFNVGDSPFAMAYNGSTEQLYVANKMSQTYSLISEDLMVDTLEASAALGNGLAISSEQNIVVSTQSENSELSIKKQTITPAISFDESYEESRKDFQFNPALLERVKVINSGTEKLNMLKLVETSMSGKQTVKNYSFRNYDSPQHFANISELHDVKGALINGHNQWKLKLPAHQKITLLFCHKQFELYDLLPETARKSTGVEMSKGIPKHWR